MTPRLPDVLKMSEAADMLRVHPVTARRWAAKGDFPVPVIVCNGVRRVNRKQLEEYIAGESARAAS